LKKYHTLIQNSQPFFLGISTINTHHPSGYIPSSYRNIVYKNGKNSMLNAVFVSDRIISKFIDAIMEDTTSQNTIIVLSSDHLAMPNAASEMLDSSPKKRNLLMYFMTGFLP
jgi:phosphoglycerol transferase